MRLLLVLLASCAETVSASGPNLVPRASFEMNCPANQMTFVQLAENTWGVSGCEQRATYRWTCRMNGFRAAKGYASSTSQCDWERDGLAAK